MQSDLVKELSSNFIEYAVAVNTDRAIPDARSGLKPVAKRILYGAYDQGFSSSKPHVKCANIVGNVMADWHPHGDSSIYGALVRLSQNWVMRYPLIDFHGSNGNRDGDGPAAYRYTEARLSKISEDGLLVGMKKDVVDFIPNYSETKQEPVTLPSIFPNLLCNPNTGIGVAIACNWLPHNLCEVADAINAYINGEEPTLPGPDFPTGGLIINKNDLPNIIKTGHGSVKVRGKYHVEDNKIIFYEIPYGVATEELMKEIGDACDAEKITGIENIRNESNKKGFRLVIECEKNANIAQIVAKLFKETSLQISISYNQVALVDKTPVELGLKDCIKIYIEHNKECLIREFTFEKNKAEAKKHIIEGLIKALEDIDNIIALIKQSESSTKAKEKLIAVYAFSEEQAKAILDMKLAKLAKLEKIELEKERQELIDLINDLIIKINHPVEEIQRRLAAIVQKYGDARRTELTQIEEKKEDKEIEYVEPEKCVVIMTEAGGVKRIPATSFRTQKRGGKGIKTQEEITTAVIRTNTIDSLMIFSDHGKMYRLLVNDIPVGTNTSKCTPIKALVQMDTNEAPATIYSIYRDTDAKYVLFVTKNGLVKKTGLKEYIETKKKTGIGAIALKDGDALAVVTLIKDEPLIIMTNQGNVIKFNSAEIAATSRMTSGVKGITLNEGDYVVAALPVRNETDDLAVFSTAGYGKRVKQEEIPIQKRSGKGVNCFKSGSNYGSVIAGQLVNDEDAVLIVGNQNSICISAKEIPVLGRATIGNTLSKGGKVLSVSKV